MSGSFGTSTLRRAVALAAAAVALTACGDDSSSGESTPPSLPDDAGHVLDITAKSVQWDRTTMRAPAGRITIRLDNQDASIPHNIRVRGPEQAFATDLEDGKVFQVLTFTIEEPGTYTYICDVHPNMEGDLVVTE